MSDPNNTTPPAAVPQGARELEDFKRQITRRLDGTVTIFGLDAEKADQWWTGYHECIKDVRRMLEETTVREAAGDGWRPIAEVQLDTDVLLYWPARMGRTFRPAYQTVGRVLSLYHYAGATHFQPLPPPPAQ